MGEYDPMNAFADANTVRKGCEELLRDMELERNALLQRAKLAEERLDVAVTCLMSVKEYLLVQAIPDVILQTNLDRAEAAAIQIDLDKIVRLSL
jgi:hypothetical protein